MFCQLFQLKYQILFGLLFPTEISETPWNKRCKTAQNILSGFVFFILLVCFVCLCIIFSDVGKNNSLNINRSLL